MADKLKVAIVHDWFVGGGAEKVVAEISKLYPDAPIYTSYCSDEWRQKLAPAQVVTGYLQNWPFSKLRKLLPVLRQHWFSHLDLSDYGLVISSSGNGEAKGVHAAEGAKHVCYCHSPTHFYWRHYEDYRANPGFGIFNPAVRLALQLLVGPLRRWDLKASKNPDYYIANSLHIKADIKKYYDRDAVVIYPPIDISRFENVTPKDRSGFVTVGRLVPYKRYDLIIGACNQLQLPLTVVGRGPELANLQKIAGPTITFDTNASDEKVVDYMASATAFIFAAHEDFGITPVEAMAAGTPVIAYKAGGALDYVTDGQTGSYFEEQTVESIVTALNSFSNEKLNALSIKERAADFSPEHFDKQFKSYLEEVL